MLADREAAQKAEAANVLQYYVNNFSEVYILICDSCKEKLAIEYLDLSKPNPVHHQARQVIPISNKLKSYRPRLDRAMGYRCACGNDTRVSDVEYGIVPIAKLHADGTMDIPPGGCDILPHHEGMVREKMSQLNYHPDIRLKGKDTITETFRVRRIT